MRSLAYWIVALGVMVPTPIFAQASAQANLTGVWVTTKPWKTKDGKEATQVDTLRLLAQGGWTRSTVNEGPDGATYARDGRRWFLSSDSLWINNAAEHIILLGKVTRLSDQELVIELPRIRGRKVVEVYKRINRS